MFIMRNGLNSLALIIASILMLGCTTQDNPLLSSFETYVKDSKETLQKRYGSVDKLAIIDAGMHDIFNEKNMESGWPRVALTINSVSPVAFTEPKRNAETGKASLGSTESCIVFSAVVWDSPTKSRNVDNINFCVSDAMRIKGIKVRNFNGNLTFNHWATGVNDCDDGNLCTGKSRTKGPNPPSKRIPAGDYTFNKFANGETYFVITFDSLLQVMGLDIQAYDSRTERRVWVTTMPNKV